MCLNYARHITSGLSLGFQCIENFACSSAKEGCGGVEHFYSVGVVGKFYSWPTKHVTAVNVVMDLGVHNNSLGINQRKEADIIYLFYCS